MMKTAILFYPFCKEDVRKLQKAFIDNNITADIYDVSKSVPDLSRYQRLGIVTGIYALEKKNAMIKYLQDNLPYEKEIFVVYTYGVYRAGYNQELHKLLAERRSIYLGEYGCLGFSSFGPFKVAGNALESAELEQELKKCAKFIIDLL